MGAITGRVVVKEAGVGVSGLVVTAYAASAEEDQGRVVGRNRRLGSIVTDDTGRFELEYESPATPQQDWDLVVTVSAPDDGDPDTDESRVALASIRRDNPAPRESFQITIVTVKLVEAGMIAAPQEPPATGPPRQPSPQEQIAASRVERDAQRLFNQEQVARLGEHLTRLDERRAANAEAFGEFIGKLSAVPPEDRASGRFGYLPPDADIAAENLRVIRNMSRGKLATASVTNVGVFDEETLAELRRRYGPQLDAVPREEVESRIWPWKRYHTGRLVVVPTWRKCGGPPRDDCEKLLEGEQVHDPAPPGPPQPPPGPSDPVPAGEPVDVETLVHLQVDSATSPETAPALRPGVDDVQNNVDGFQLRSGPADNPALFDFHHLRIAFEPVWQELFDDGIVEVAHELYDKIAEAGADPNKYLFTEGDKIKFGYPKDAVSSDKDVELPPENVVRAFEITPQEWNALDYGHQEKLKELADELNAGMSRDYWFPENLVSWMPWKKDRLTRLRRQGERMIAYARSLLAESETFDHFHDMLGSLSAAVKEPYRFNVYAANNVSRSINFGIVVNYRQRWEPVAYQVGELVKTVPLAPKEVRKFTKRTVVKTSRSQKEVNNSLLSRRTESSDTWRAESEVVSKAMSKSNFQMSAEGGVNIGIAQASGKSAFGHDTAAESSEVKKEFREAVFKAAEEYKQERNLQVETTDSTEATLEETGEISNPNDEIPVTYLFYQLQRRFRVSEHIHSVVPVVLVAQEFPNPKDIDEDWIVRHDWILRRTLLDDSYLPALSYLSTKVVGDEVALRELHQNLQQHRALTDELKDEVIAIRADVAHRYTTLERAVAAHADAVQADEEGGGIIPMPVGFLVDDSDVSVEATKLREEAARDALERAARAEKDLQARLDREVTALAALSDTYTKQLSEHLNRRAQISRLRVHIKQNIFYYMQAIWAHEPNDQRFFRLHDVAVPRLAGTKTYKIEPDPEAIPLPPDWKKPQKLTVHSELDVDNLEFDALGDIADLDNPLGCKGNLMIFPMVDGNDLTDLLMTPYYNPVAQLTDPDPLGNWTLHDFVDYVCCLRKEMSKGQFERMLPGLIEVYRALKDRGAADEEIIVPTDSLYIEALPGVRPVLEDFKLLHRAVDVKKVQAEVRGAELENVRMAARLLAGEREDPTIEKKIVVEGHQDIVVPEP